MTAVYENPAFDEPELDIDNLPGALRAGLTSLHDAAEAAGLAGGVVDGVVGHAWDPFTGFTARGVADFSEVVDLAIHVNGRNWTEAVLVDPDRRDAEFRRVTAAARRIGHVHFSRLPEAEREAAADDTMVRLSRLMLKDPVSGLNMPAWASWNVVKRNTRWHLLTAVKQFDRDRKPGDDGSCIVSLDAYWEAVGEQGVSGIDYGSGAVDDSGVEAAVWAAAGASLAESANTMLAGTRAGAVHAKLALTIDAAQWVLAKGSEDSLDDDGKVLEGSAEETRHEFAQDALLVCFLGLRSVALATWGRYPDDKVPTREVIDRVAKKAAGIVDINAGWFARLEARRVDVAKSDRILHGSRRLVESLLKEAAHDDGN